MAFTNYLRLIFMNLPVVFFLVSVSLVSPYVFTCTHICFILFNFDPFLSVPLESKRFHNDVCNDVVALRYGSWS